MISAIVQLLSGFSDFISICVDVLSNILHSLITFIGFSTNSLEFLGLIANGSYGISGILFTGVVLSMAGVVLRIIVDLL